jgi:hypothetical protein
MAWLYREWLLRKYTDSRYNLNNDLSKVQKILRA